MKNKLKLTYATGIVLESIAQGYCYGFDIMDISGLPDGTVYPALRRLEDAALLRAAWEDEDQSRRMKRPARRYYRLTPAGEKLLKEARQRFRGLQRALSTTGSPQPRKA